MVRNTGYPHHLYLAVVLFCQLASLVKVRQARNSYAVAGIFPRRVLTQLSLDWPAAASSKKSGCV